MQPDWTIHAVSRGVYVRWSTKKNNASYDRIGHTCETIIRMIVSAILVLVRLLYV